MWVCQCVCVCVKSQLEQLESSSRTCYLIRTKPARRLPCTADEDALSSLFFLFPCLAALSFSLSLYPFLYCSAVVSRHVLCASLALHWYKTKRKQNLLPYSSCLSLPSSLPHCPPHCLPHLSSPSLSHLCMPLAAGGNGNAATFMAGNGIVESISHTLKLQLCGKLKKHQQTAITNRERDNSNNNNNDKSNFSWSTSGHSQQKLIINQTPRRDT